MYRWFRHSLQVAHCSRLSSQPASWMAAQDCETWVSVCCAGGLLLAGTRSCSPSRSSSWLRRWPSTPYSAAQRLTGQTGRIWPQRDSCWHSSSSSRSAAPLSEEVGWRGYALPRLLASRSALTASLIIGVLWSVWHLPVVLTDPATRPPAPFLLQVPPLAVLFTWVFVNTRGSLLIAIVFHAWYDLVLMYVVAMVVSADYERVFWLLAAMQVLAAVVVLLVARWRPASRALAVGA